jgi:hypothetical protein
MSVGCLFCLYDVGFALGYYTRRKCGWLEGCEKELCALGRRFNNEYKTGGNSWLGMTYFSDRCCGRIKYLWLSLDQLLVLLTRLLLLLPPRLSRIIHTYAFIL